MTQSQSSKEMATGYAARTKAFNILVYVILAVMVIIWIFPIIWLILV